MNAVQTRQQTKRAQSPVTPLKVPEPIAGVNPDAIRQEQAHDGTLLKIRNMAGSGKTNIRNNSSVTYVKKNGIIFREFHSQRVQNDKKFCQLVVPKCYRQAVMKMAHESIMSGHLGTGKTVNRALSEFFWPGIHSDIKQYCRSCDACQRAIPIGRISKAPLGKLPLIDTPFKRVAVDIIGPLNPVTDRRNRYILTLVDYATRYPEAIALPSIEAERVAEALIEMFSRIGFPQEMLTDMGSLCTGNLMAEVSRLISLKQLTTSPYHSMCNGLVEKFNGTLKQMLKRMCAVRPNDWAPLLFAYREVPQDSLGFSPFELVRW